MPWFLSAEINLANISSLAENLKDLGQYTLSLKTVLNESNATSFGGRELPSYELNFTIKGKEIKTFTVIFTILSECPNDTLLLFLSFSEGCAESFVIGAMNSTLLVGVPFDIPLLIKDGYDHSVMPPPNLKPELKCRWVTPLDLFTSTVVLKKRFVVFPLFSTHSLLTSFLVSWNGFYPTTASLCNWFVSLSIHVTLDILIINHQHVFNLPAVGVSSGPINIIIIIL